MKILGVTYDDKLTFKPHIMQLARTAAGQLASLRRISWLLDNRGRELLYKAQIRSTLEYSCLAWGGAAPSHIAVLDKVQQRAERIIWDGQQRQPGALLCLQHRRDVAGLTTFFKAERRTEVFTRTVAAEPGALALSRSHSTHHRRQFTQVYTKLWNCLLASDSCPNNLTNITVGLQRFKVLVHRWLSSVPRHFNNSSTLSHNPCTPTITTSYPVPTTTLSTYITTDQHVTTTPLTSTVIRHTTSPIHFFSTTTTTTLHPMSRIFPLLQQYLISSQTIHQQYYNPSLFHHSNIKLLPSHTYNSATTTNASALSFVIADHPASRCTLPTTRHPAPVRGTNEAVARTRPPCYRPHCNRPLRALSTTYNFSLRYPELRTKNFPP
ncbi:hypothetical protein Pmani_013474 [Petrolisthes manimaculis]|uniref:Uncharacterized protein n=1 Tax=Petrolisthes manimaculis TaxID=1843537 RepID=A0AAE1U9B6_9EUCA|nr:hypothetical protein Pmani_013474 [Petrolisthes manimaculis]